MSIDEWVGKTHLGDAWALGRQLHETCGRCVDVIVTSPPYYNLKKYGSVPGQIGNEATVDEYIARLTGLFGMLVSALKPTGSLWINLGDKMAGDTLLFVPSRLAIALTADGWLCRNEIVWVKSRFMPTPARDRLSMTHESVFHLVREKGYYYDLDSIREPYTEVSKARAKCRYFFHQGEGGVRETRQVAGITLNPKGKAPPDVHRVCPVGRGSQGDATFPPALIRPRILSTCPPGGVVLDPFAGTGTTQRVAEAEGRRYIGFEINPEAVRATWEVAQEKMREVEVRDAAGV